MNHVDMPQGPPDPEKFERPDFRAALEGRDYTQLFRLLQKIGYSQQRIAALCGMSQPEVSAVVHGRKIMAYTVMRRILRGLNINPTYAGLAFGTCTSPRTCAAARLERSAPAQAPGHAAVRRAAATAAGARCPLTSR